MRKRHATLSYCTQTIYVELLRKLYCRQRTTSVHRLGCTDPVPPLSLYAPLRPQRHRQNTTPAWDSPHVRTSLSRVITFEVFERPRRSERTLQDPGTAKNTRKYPADGAPARSDAADATAGRNPLDFLLLEDEGAGGPAHLHAVNPMRALVDARLRHPDLNTIVDGCNDNKRD